MQPSRQDAADQATGQGDPEMTRERAAQPAAPGQAAGPLPTTAPGPDASPAIRASDRERDAATQQLQAAFAEGRLDDTEFDGRMRTALTARTRGDLAALLTDLPGALPGARSRPVAVPHGRPPGRFAITFKSSIRRSGRWRVPEHYTAVIYKGTGWLDLRAAELTAPETTIVAVAYKSRVDILVPPGVRVEMGGFGGSTGGADDAILPPDAPVVHVRGYAYKGTIEARSTPPEQ